MSFLLATVLMFAFWLLLSGRFTFILLFSGVVSSLLTAYLSHDLLFGGFDLRRTARMTVRFFIYLPWLFWQIVLASLDVAYRTLHPALPIDPQIITFYVDFETDAARAILANSITLTPGTVTIEADRTGKFTVHAVTPGAAEGLISGEMIKKVKWIEA